MAEKSLLILDLDETLIHATAAKIREDFDFQVYDYYVYKRPGLAEFLTRCGTHFTLAVWSSAGEGELDGIGVQRGGVIRIVEVDGFGCDFSGSLHTL
jgi:TFIIF-interacting CTD phosphatase-like protein